MGYHLDALMKTVLRDNEKKKVTLSLHSCIYDEAKTKAEELGVGISLVVEAALCDWLEDLKEEETK